MMWYYYTSDNSSVNLEGINCLKKEGVQACMVAAILHILKQKTFEQKTLSDSVTLSC